jgi:peptidoglycan hydrolase-like protein with peptidoglycan-binding domain
MRTAFQLARPAIVTAAIMICTTASMAQNVPSGMLLGVYAFENFRGLRVTGTIPGYSAQGRLFPGDTLLQVSDGTSVYSARSRFEFEMAKDRIGPNRWAALEVWRPQAGLIYFWVQFTPIGGGPAITSQGIAAAPQQMKAEIRTEAERPAGRQSARSLFQRGGNSNTRPGPSNPNAGRPDNRFPGDSQNNGRLRGRDLRSLFGR